MMKKIIFLLLLAAIAAVAAWYTLDNSAGYHDADWSYDEGWDNGDYGSYGDDSAVGAKGC